MADAFLLSASDRQLLKGMLAAERRRIINVQGRRGLDPEEYQLPPEVYVALTPSTGIPALEESDDLGTAFGSGDVLSYADCAIYRKIVYGGEDVLVRAGFYHRVYNLWDRKIPGNQWLLIHRDKYGEWYAERYFSIADADGTECTGCGGWAGILQGQCVTVYVESAGLGGACRCIDTDQGPFYLRNTGEGDGYTWLQKYGGPGTLTLHDPTYTFSTCCDDGVYSGTGAPTTPKWAFEFSLDDNWTPRLRLVGTLTACDGSTITNPNFALDCCTCNPTRAWFRGGGNAFCPQDNLSTQSNNPCSNTFLLRVEAGGSECADKVVTSCCGGAPLPKTMYLHVDVDDPAMSFLAGDFTVTWNSGSSSWVTSTPIFCDTLLFNPVWAIICNVVALSDPPYVTFRAVPGSSLQPLTFTDSTSTLCSAISCSGSGTFRYSISGTDFTSCGGGVATGTSPGFTYTLIE